MCFTLIVWLGLIVVVVVALVTITCPMNDLWLMLCSLWALPFKVCLWTFCCGFWVMGTRKMGLKIGLGWEKAENWFFCSRTRPCPRTRAGRVVLCLCVFLCRRGGTRPCLRARVGRVPLCFLFNCRNGARTRSCLRHGLAVFWVLCMFFNFLSSCDLFHWTSWYVGLF